MATAIPLEVSHLAAAMKARIIREARASSIPNFEVRDDFIQWLAAKLHAANFTARDTQHVKFLTCDPSTYSHAPSVVSHYAIIQLIVPQGEHSTVVTGRIIWAHGTTEGGLVGILRTRKMMPTKPFYADQPEPFTAFMALGCRVYGIPEDNDEVARIVHKTWNLPKNRCNVLAVGVAHGACSTIRQGGAWESLLKAKTDLVVHESATKRWAIKCAAGCFTSIAFASGATPGTG
jgi:hypothetical protein